MDPMELVLSKSETVPPKAIFKSQYKRYIFKTEQNSFNFKFITFTIFSTININFRSLQIIFNKPKISDSTIYPI
jgi:hypothetical protein